MEDRIDQYSRTVQPATLRSSVLHTYRRRPGVLRARTDLWPGRPRAARAPWSHRSSRCPRRWPRAKHSQFACYCGKATVRSYTGTASTRAPASRARRRRSETTEALRGCPSVVAPDNEQVRSRTSCRQPIVGWLWLAHSSHRASISAAFVRYADLPASLAGAKPILQASST